MRFELTLTGLTNRSTAIVLQPPLIGAPRWIRTIVSALPWQRVTITHYGSILARGTGFEPVILISKTSALDLTKLTPNILASVDRFELP